MLRTRMIIMSLYSKQAKVPTINKETKPHPIEHMLLWGATSGALLSPMYVYALVTFGSPLSAITPYLCVALLIPYSLGIFWGALLGFINGMALKLLTMQIPVPFAKESIDARRKTIYPAIFLMPILIQSLIFMPLFSARRTPPQFTLLFYLAIPALIAAIASTYAAHRFLYRLQLWSASQDMRKPKLADEAFHRLEDQIEQSIPEIIIAERKMASRE